MVTVSPEVSGVLFGTKGALDKKKKKKNEKKKKHISCKVTKKRHNQ